MRTLRLQGRTNVVALKATGTSSFAELATYLDFGAVEAFDSIDFGFPTYRVGRKDIVELFSMPSISACRYRPMPWWWNAPAIRCLPMRPSFLSA